MKEETDSLKEDKIKGKENKKVKVKVKKEVDLLQVKSPEVRNKVIKKKL